MPRKKEGKEEGRGAVPAASAAAPSVSLKGLRKSAHLTQEDLADALSVGQDTISRLEKRHDMLVSTLRHYVEGVGGQLALVADVPGQAPVTIDLLGEHKRSAKKRRRHRNAAEQHGP